MFTFEDCKDIKSLFWKIIKEKNQVYNYGVLLEYPLRSESSSRVEACTCAFLPSCSSNIMLPVGRIMGSVALPRCFPTRLSHEAFPQGCPTCHRGVSQSSAWKSRRKGLLWVVLICPSLLLLGLLVIESLNWRKSCTSHRQETAEKQSRKYKNKSVKKRFWGGLIHKIPHILCQKQKTSSLLWILLSYQFSSFILIIMILFE